MSHSTSTLNPTGSVAVICVSGGDVAQTRHSRHVFTMLGIISNVELGITRVAASICRICSGPACHHRMCSLLSSTCFAAYDPVLNVDNDLDTSNRDQSLGTGVPADASIVLGGMFLGLPALDSSRLTLRRGPPLPDAPVADGSSTGTGVSGAPAACSSCSAPKSWPSRSWACLSTVYTCRYCWLTRVLALSRGARSRVPLTSSRNSAFARHVRMV